VIEEGAMAERKGCNKFHAAILIADDLTMRGAIG
jgi:hypothetical protein